MMPGQAGRVLAALAGRAARVWWRRLPADKRALLVSRHRARLGSAGLVLAGGLGYAYESHIQVQLPLRYFSNTFARSVPLLGVEDLLRCTLTRPRGYPDRSSPACWRNTRMTSCRPATRSTAEVTPLVFTLQKYSACCGFSGGGVQQATAGQQGHAADLRQGVDRNGGQHG